MKLNRRRDELCEAHAKPFSKLSIGRSGRWPPSGHALRRTQIILSARHQAATLAIDLPTISAGRMRPISARRHHP